MPVAFPARALALAVAAFCLGVTADAAAQSPAPAPVPNPEPKTVRVPWWISCKEPLDPQIEKALAEVAAKITPIRKGELAEHMRLELEALVAFAKLDDKTLLAGLQKAADEAVEESVKPFPQRVTETNRFRLPVKETNAALSAIEGWNLEGIAANRLVLGCLLPEDQPVWQKAVQAVLSPEQHAAWQKRLDGIRAGREKLISSCLTPWVDSARVRASAAIQDRITSMTPVLDLDKSTAAALRSAEIAAAERLANDERQRAEESLRFVTGVRLQELVDRNAVFRAYTLDVDPEFDPEAQQALAKLMGPDKAAVWAKHVAGRKERLAVEVAKLINLSLDRMRASWENLLAKELGAITAELEIPEDRLKRLESVKTAVLGRAEKTWKPMATARLNELPEASRENLLKQGRGYFISLQSADAPQNDAEWKKALADLVTPEERRQLTLATEARQARRELAMGRLLLAELDKEIALTTRQRELLLPVTTALMKSESSFFPPAGSDFGFSHEAGLFFRIASRAKEEEVKPVLDSLQWQAWKNLEKIIPPGRNRNVPADPFARANAEKKPATPPVSHRKPEPEDLENIIADYLYEKGAAGRDQLLREMITAAEDAARVTGLPDEARARLRTAARGTVEGAIQEWRPTMESNVRAQVQGANVSDIRQRLVSIDDYYFTYRGSRPALELDLWKKAAAAELGDDRLKKWQVELDARRDFLSLAMASVALAEFDRKVLLTAEQAAKLEPVVQGLVKDYHADLLNYFSGSSPWYLQYYSVLVPFAGVPEKDMKAVLGKTQWQRWSGSSEFGNSMNYWTNLAQNRQNRLRINR